MLPSLIMILIFAELHEMGGEKIMSVSEILIKVGGIILFVVGLALILSVVGLNLIGVHLDPPILGALVGLVLLGAGIYIVRGGNITF